MMNNRKMNIVLSLVVAFCAWLYVIYNVDPSTTRTYSDVPVAFTNEDSLAADGLALKSVSKSTVQVVLTGKRSTLNQIKDSDLKAVVNLSGVGKGENTVKLKIRKPSDVSVDSQSDTKVTVNVEKAEQAQVPMRVTYTEDASDDSEPLSVEGTEETFTVIGAKSLVNRVKYVKASVDESKLSEEAHTYNVSLTAVDYKGDAISHVRVNPSKTSVTVIKGTTKRVPLNVMVTNSSDDQYKRTYEVASKVTIKGTAEAVKKVSSIRTQTIDLSDVNSSGRIAVECILPDGVVLANDSQDLLMTVNVAKYKTKTVSFKTKDISVKNLNSKYSLSFDDSTVKIRVTDTASNLKELTAGDFTVSVDAKDLTSGSHELKATVKCSEKLYKAVISDGKINVTISKKD